MPPGAQACAWVLACGYLSFSVFNLTPDGGQDCVIFDADVADEIVQELANASYTACGKAGEGLVEEKEEEEEEKEVGVEEKEKPLCLLPS